MPRHAPRPLALVQQHAPFQPPLAHKVRIPAPYVPACATDVRATIERVQAQLAAQAARPSRKARTAPAGQVQQADLFLGATVVCIDAVQRRAA
ncbi:hypothetical protein ACA040_002223 [Xenophilus aerolatus]